MGGAGQWGQSQGRVALGCAKVHVLAHACLPNNARQGHRRTRAHAPAAGAHTPPACAPARAQTHTAPATAHAAPAPRSAGRPAGSGRRRPWCGTSPAGVARAGQLCHSAGVRRFDANGGQAAAAGRRRCTGCSTPFRRKHHAPGQPCMRTRRIWPAAGGEGPLPRSARARPGQPPPSPAHARSSAASWRTVGRPGSVPQQHEQRVSMGKPAPSTATHTLVTCP